MEKNVLKSKKYSFRGKKVSMFSCHRKNDKILKIQLCKLDAFIS